MSPTIASFSVIAVDCRAPLPATFPRTPRSPGYTLGKSAISVFNSVRASATVAAAAQPSHTDVSVGKAVAGGARDHRGEPRVRTRLGKRERRRHDADDRRGHAVQRDGCAQHRGVAAESAHPEPVRQDSDQRSARCALLCREPATARRRHPQHRRQGRCRPHHLDALRLAPAGQRRFAGAVDGQTLEGARPLVLVIEARRQADARRNIDTRHAVIQPDQPVGLWIRQRIQHHALHDGEDGRVGPDGERERQRGSKGEYWGAQQSSGGLPDLIFHATPAGPLFKQRARQPDL